MQSGVEDYCAECVMPMHDLPEEQDGLLKCVTCPFCKETVNAVLTEDTIECPKCLAIVKR